MRAVSVCFAGALAGYLALTPAIAVTFESVAVNDATMLLVEGRFEPDEDMGRFIAAVAADRPDFVTFNSPGGAIYPAMQLGRFIRAFELPTLQIRSSECASACALAFLGGIYRAAEAGSIGVHQSSFAPESTLDRDQAVSAVQTITADILAYMNEMGAGPGLMQLSLQYASGDMRYLSQSEMLEHGVISGDGSTAQPPLPPAAPQMPPIATTPPASSQNSQAMARLQIPEARSGWVRHPKGEVHLKAGPDGDSASFGTLRNRTALQILGSDGRWYAVSVGGTRGYLHDTWVLVDQFESGPFEARHIQIKSYEHLHEAEAYARRSPLPVSVYLATNGWFAVTLEETHDKDTGTELLELLKARKEIPDDSYLSYGNTYARKMCCR